MVTSIGEEESIVMQQKIWMLALTDEINDFTDKFPVLLHRCLSADQSRVLLDAPHCPQKDIGFLHLTHHDVRVRPIHKVI